MFCRSNCLDPVLHMFKSRQHHNLFEKTKTPVTHNNISVTAPLPRFTVFELHWLGGICLHRSYTHNCAQHTITHSHTLAVHTDAKYIHICTHTLSLEIYVTNVSIRHDLKPRDRQ